MSAPCNQDCFNCLFEDCLYDEITYADIREQRALDKELTQTKESRKLAAYQKDYYERNKAEIAAYKKDYYERNKAEIAAYKKDYRERNKAEIAARKKDYYERNKAEIAAYQKDYRERNKARFGLLGKSICAARISAGLSRAALAERLGVSRAGVSAYENGYTAPPVERLLAVLPGLEVVLG